MNEAERLKASRYNLLFPLEDGTRLAFNAATAALASIDAETLPSVVRLLQEPTCVKNSTEETLLQSLVAGGYLVPEKQDEREELWESHRRGRTENTTFFLTVAPTLACNFDCNYCFQRHESMRMSPETERALISFAAERIRRSESVIVTWFGGEPTLCMATIDRVQAALVDLTGENGATLYPSSIVTNGYFLDRANANRLRMTGVASAQVTLDGPRDLHDRRRPLRGGQGTYDRILENLAECADLLQIVIRVNVDASNMERAGEVLQDLDRVGVLQKVQVYFAPVNETEAGCADMKGRCFTTEEFARRQVALYDKLVAGGFTGIEYPELSAGGFCGADTENGFVVGPNGLLFKCWEELSLDGGASVGSLFEEPDARQTANLDRYRSWDPSRRSACAGCEILPLCLGGCPKEGLMTAVSDRGACSPWKFNLTEMLRLRYLCDTERR